MLCSKDGILQDLVGLDGILPRFLWDSCGIFWDFEGYDEIYGGFSGISTRFFWDSFEFRQDSLKVLRDFMGSRQDPFWILSPQPQKFQ